MADGSCPVAGRSTDDLKVKGQFRVLESNQDVVLWFCLHVVAGQLRGYRSHVKETF
jgi:hypothetical protein